MPTEPRILEHRIEELESEVGELIAFPGDEHARRLRNVGEVSHSIRRRINFLRTLLFAEKYETQAAKKLNHMNTRLADLESKFTDWVGSQDPGESDGGNGTSSSCSCTHSCANEVNGEEDSCEEVAVEQADHHLVGEDGWFEAVLGVEEYELLAKEEAGEEKAAQLQGKEEAMEENSGQNRRGRRGRRSLLSAGLGVVLAYAIFHVFVLFNVENNIYPIPT